MAGIKSIELVTEAEKSLESYKVYLEKLARKEDDGTIFNEGKDHASILMATLLANTNTSIKMYCTGLKPDLLEEYNGAYWKEFQIFFGNVAKNTVNVEILIQDNTWFNNNTAPFVTLKNAKTIGFNISVRKIKKEDIPEIKTSLGFKDEENVNFSIFDGKAYRLEYDAANFKAISDFDNAKRCAELSKEFDKAFNNAIILL